MRAFPLFEAILCENPFEASIVEFTRAAFPPNLAEDILAISSEPSVLPAQLSLTSAIGDPS